MSRKQRNNRPFCQIDARTMGRAYHQSVVRRLIDVVNGDDRICLRVLDGSHVALTNGDRSVTPFKVSASRPPVDTLRYLDDWLRSWGGLPG